MPPTPFPKIPITAWRTLRSRAAAAPSTRFNPSTVAALLDMASPRSATDNIITPLRKLGLIDDEGSLTDRGNRWRIDASYADACQEILDDIYPSDLTALTDETGKPDKQRIGNWMQHQGFGDSNARQMAATYVLIAEKTIPTNASSDSSKAKPKARVSKGQTKTPSPAKAAQTPEQLNEEVVTPPAPASPPRGPNVHLDIQIHIPADASLEQIDHIFASMAKHLYQR